MNQTNQMKTLSVFGRCKIMMGLTLALAAGVHAETWDLASPLPPRLRSGHPLFQRPSPQSKFLAL